MTTPAAPLPWLIARLTRLIQAATDTLEQQYPDGVQAWQAELSRQLARYSAASYMVGNGAPTLTPQARAAVTKDIAVQVRFLGKFAVVVQDGKAWEKGWNARAAMYAESIKAPYWRGKTKLLPLPAMPGDGTTSCLTHCDCTWEIVQLDGDNNYDCYWRLGSTEHCQGCIQRANDWSPLQIRDGVLQL